MFSNLKRRIHTLGLFLYLILTISMSAFASVDSDYIIEGEVFFTDECLDSSNKLDTSSYISNQMERRCRFDLFKSYGQPIKYLKPFVEISSGMKALLLEERLRLSTSNDQDSLLNRCFTQKTVNRNYFDTTCLADGLKLRKSEKKTPEKMLSKEDLEQRKTREEIRVYAIKRKMEEVSANLERDRRYKDLTGETECSSGWFELYPTGDCWFSGVRINFAYWSNLDPITRASRQYGVPRYHLKRNSGVSFAPALMLP